MKQQANKPQRRGATPRRGISALRVIAALVALAGAVSAGVDIGTVQSARAQLQRCADAAARAAAARLPSPKDAQKLAMQYALANAGDDLPMVLDADKDIEFGVFDESTSTFRTLPDADRSSADAIRVTIRRTQSRANAVPLKIGRMIGLDTWNTEASCVAHARQRFFGIVGIDAVKLDGKLTLDSYDSGSAAYSAVKSRGNAGVASNVDIHLGSDVVLNGAARARSLETSPSTKIGGKRTPINFILRYDLPDSSAIAVNNSNANISSDYLSGGKFDLPAGAEITLPGGTYYFKRFNIGENATLKFTGPATLWVAGDVNIRGCIVPAQKLPPLFKLRVVAPNSTVALAPQTDFYADVYAPQSTVNVTGDADFFGGIIGKTVTVSGPNLFHFDETLAVNGLWANVELNH